MTQAAGSNSAKTPLRLSTVDESYSKSKTCQTSEKTAVEKSWKIDYFSIDSESTQRDYYIFHLLIKKIVFGGEPLGIHILQVFLRDL